MRSELFTMILGKLSRTDRTVSTSTYTLLGPCALHLTMRRKTETHGLPRNCCWILAQHVAFYSIKAMAATRFFLSFFVCVSIWLDDKGANHIMVLLDLFMIYNAFCGARDAPNGSRSLDVDKSAAPTN